MTDGRCPFVSGHVCFVVLLIGGEVEWWSGGGTHPHNNCTVHDMIPTHPLGTDLLLKSKPDPKTPKKKIRFSQSQTAQRNIFTDSISIYGFFFPTEFLAHSASSLPASLFLPITVLPLYFFRDGKARGEMLGEGANWMTGMEKRMEKSIMRTGEERKLVPARRKKRNEETFEMCK